MAKRGGGYNLCAALYCNHNRKRNPNLSFFRFPKNPKVCRQWILNSKRFDLLNKDPAYLYANCIICSTHFEESQFTSPQRNRLLDMAVPTKFPIGAPTVSNDLLDSMGDEICMEVEAQMQAISPNAIKKGVKVSEETPMISTSIFSESKALLSTKTVTFSSKPRIFTTQIPASQIQNSNIVTFANSSAKQMTTVGSKDQPKLIFLTKLPVTQTLATKTPPPSPGVTVMQPNAALSGKPITPGVESAVSLLPDNPEIETKYKIPGTSDSANDDFGASADYSYSGGFDGSQFSSSVLQDSTNSVDESYDNTYDTSYNEPCAPPAAKRKRYAGKPAPPTDATRVGRNHSSSDENLSDNYQAFSELVVAQLKALPPSRAAILQMKIQSLLSKTIAGSEEDGDQSEEETFGNDKNEFSVETANKSDSEVETEREEKSPRPARSEDCPRRNEAESTQVETTTTTTMVTTIAKKKSLRQQDCAAENKENQQVALDNVYTAFSKCIVSQLKFLPASVAMKTQNRIQKVMSDEIVRFHNTRTSSENQDNNTEDTPVNSPSAVQIKQEPEDSNEY